ncbi:hypothetical protein B0H16DRAFT_1752381 [Mycena metata]|uniref:Uncharacterized protein n=1 Tax=Mycena metata TaxID=1033252 RepID=A0AAD7GIU7_9AGAR|nr:hypothetical protein B0H16DRAFT_1752381 [Mycena metata]
MSDSSSTLTSALSRVSPSTRSDQTILTHRLPPLSSTTHQGQTILTQHFFAVKTMPKRRNFSPERLMFLRGLLDDFYWAVAQGELSSFWATTFSTYWSVFPWRLPIHVDPHPMMTLDAIPFTRDEVDERTVVRLNTQAVQNQGLVSAQARPPRSRSRLNAATSTNDHISSSVVSTFPRPSSRPLCFLDMYPSFP